MGALVDALAQAASAITGAKAYTDPADAVNNRPCLLMAPPTLDYTAGTMTGPAVRFRIIALSSYDVGSYEAMAELEDLIEAADSSLNVERAEPIQYPLNTGNGRVAAYLLTTTDYPIDRS